MSQKQISILANDSYCVLKEHFVSSLIDACRDAFCPLLLAYLKVHGNEPNRGPHRHFLPMPFEPPCFAPGLPLASYTYATMNTLLPWNSFRWSSTAVR